MTATDLTIAGVALAVVGWLVTRLLRQYDVMLQDLSSRVVAMEKEQALQGAKLSAAFDILAGRRTKR